jgi:predicted porin
VRAATSTSGTESSNGANSDPSAYSASAVYASGPLYATLAHEIHKNSFTSWDAATTITGTKAGVGFAFGGTKLAAVYETLNDDKANSPFSRNALYLALSQKLGRETIKLAYGIADDGDNPVTETGATQITAGIDHAFSKRTTIYALYSTMDNDRDATYGLGQSGAGGAFTPGAGEDPSVVSVGINHLF